MSNRPKDMRSKAARIPDDELDVEYTPVGKRPKDILLQIGVVILVVAFLMTSGLVCVLPDPPEQQAQEQQQERDSALVEIERYSKILEQNPNDAEALANLGHYTMMRAMEIEQQAQMQDLTVEEFPADGATPSAETAPPVDPEVEKMTLLATSEGHLRKALEQEPNLGFARQELARNLLIQEREDEANSFIEESIALLDETIESDEESGAAEAKRSKAELLRFQAIMASQTENSEAAIGYLDQAIELRPGDGQLYIQRGQNHLQAGREDAAREDFEIAVDIGQQTRDQQVAMIGQILLDSLDQEGSSAPAATPVAPAPTPTATP